MCGLLYNVVFLLFWLVLGFCFCGALWAPDFLLPVPFLCVFFPGLLLFVPAGVSGYGCFFVPASRHFVFPDWCFLRPKRGFGFPQMSCVPRNGVFPPRPGKVYISDGILRSH